MRAHKIRMLAAALAVTTLFGCQTNPDHNAVVSKNDGAFDAAILETAPADGADGIQAQQLRCQDRFLSSDGSIAFALDVDQTVDLGALSVVEVEPYYFTEEDVQRIANILLPGAQFYECQPEYVEKKFSKSQLQEKIARASQYASAEGLKLLYGSRYNANLFVAMDANGRELGTDLTPVERYKNEINSYMEMLETASDEDPRTPCDFSWKLATYYQQGPEEAARRSGVGEERQIQANADANGIEYSLCASKYDGKDYKISSLTLTVFGSLSPWAVDELIYSRQILAGEDPSQAQIDAAVEQAKDLLRQIGIGDWEVDGGSVDYVREGLPVIRVYAGPMLRGVPSMWKSQEIRVGGEATQMVYASAKVGFEFSADGVLTWFQMDAPIQEAATVNPRPVILSADKMLSRAKEHLTLMDSQNFISAWDLKNLKNDQGHLPQLHLDITELSFGMIRVDVKDAPGKYYYVPGMVLSGSRGLYDPDSGACLVRSGEPDSWLGSAKTRALVGINAIDGSIIPVA